MIFDRTTLLSEAQAITADAASTNIIDMGAPGTVYGAAAALTRDYGKGSCIPLQIQVVEAFNNLTSLRIVVQTDDNVGFSTPKDVIEQVVPLARLIAGFTSSIIEVPHGAAERYIRVFYDITGTAPTTGKVTAGVVLGGPQSNGVAF